MANPPKGPQVVRAKLAPTQLVLLCLTLRDTFGSPIVGMKLTVKEAGKELKAPGGGNLVTSDKGRVDIADVQPVGTLDIVLDPDFLPVDREDRRSNTKYLYTIAKVTEIVEYAITDDPDNKSPVDPKRAFVTAFAAPNPFDPIFRFPWQNPVHHEKVEGKDRIYASRVVNLSFALQALFNVKKADADALDHKGQVARLVDLFEQSKATVAAEAALASAASPTDQGTEHEPEKPPPSRPVPLPVEPSPEDPLKLTRKIDVTDKTPKPEQPAPLPPKPPATAPSATTDSASLPRWVWYMLFHHTGLRYTPKLLEPQKFGAHGTYVHPGLILKKMREREIENQLEDTAPAPDAADITEALALAERSKQNDAAKALILTTDPKKQKAGISAVFAAIVEAELQRLNTIRGPGDNLTGDYFALGLLKAKRLKKHTLLADAAWESVTSCTPLRNDVQKDDWERLPLGEALAPIFLNNKDREANAKIDQENIKRAARKEPLLTKKGPGLDSTQWRTRRQQTLDTILSAAVCDQTSESGELVRGHTLAGGIPANARRCASLQLFIFSNASFIRRGMHLFYSGFGPAGADQDYPTTSMPWQDAKVFVNRLPPTDKARREATSIADMALVKLDDVIDPEHPINKAIERKNAARPKEPLTPRSIVDPAKRFEGVRRMAAASLQNSAPGEAFVKCVDEKTSIQDPSKPTGTMMTLDVVRLHVMKWTHQELVVDVVTRPGAVRVCLFSTAGGESHNGGTGIRTYNLLPNSIDATMDVVFGFIDKTTSENVSRMDACYLNPGILRR